MVGNYSVQINAMAPNYINKTAQFFLRVLELEVSSIVSTAQEAPYFIGELQGMMNVSINCSKIYKLPAVKNTDPLSKPNISVNLPNFVSFNETKYLFTISPFLSQHIGTHMVEMTLFNDKNQSRNYSFFI